MMDTELVVIAGSGVRFHQDEDGHNDVGALDLHRWQDDHNRHYRRGHIAIGTPRFGVYLP